MKMLSLRNIMCVPIKYIFSVHLVLALWVSDIPYVPQSAFLYNLLFLVSLFWATEKKESNEPLHFAICINLLSMLFDGSQLVRRFDTFFVYHQYTYGLPLLLSVATRIFTSISLYMIGKRRNEANTKMFSSISTKDVPEVDCINIQT